MSVLRELLLGLSRSQALRDLALRLPPARALARRFVAGDTQEEAIAVVRRLAAEGFVATLDHLGEDVASEQEARRATDEGLALVEAIEASGVPSGVSIKLTQLGLGLSTEMALDHARQIVARAAQAGRFVRLDMESYPTVEATLSILEALWGPFDNVGAVIQAYLYRSAEDVQRLSEMGVSIRLVKGAYREPASVALQRKAEIDASFARLAEWLLENSPYVALATHDARLIHHAQTYAQQHGIGRDRFEVQMLYGIRNRLQRDLVATGYTVRVYVPYGTEWYSYSMRRVAERPANLMLLVRNLFRS
jgi:proline dehydrogenase